MYELKDSEKWQRRSQCRQWQSKEKQNSVRQAYEVDFQDLLSDTGREDGAVVEEFGLY